MANAELEARLAKLETRVQELEDDRAIKELLARYGYNADCGREKEYVELYTDDGALDLSVADGPYSGNNRFQGKKALYDFITNPDMLRHPDIQGKVMHGQGNNVVTHIQGDEAVVNSYSIVLQGDGAGVRVISAGNDQWRLEKINGQWRFKERRRRQVGGPGYTENLDATPE